MFLSLSFILFLFYIYFKTNKSFLFFITFLYLSPNFYFKLLFIYVYFVFSAFCVYLTYTFLPFLFFLFLIFFLFWFLYIFSLILSLLFNSYFLSLVYFCAPKYIKKVFHSAFFGYGFSMFLTFYILPNSNFNFLFVLF